MATRAGAGRTAGDGSARQAAGAAPGPAVGAGPRERRSGLVRLGEPARRAVVGVLAPAEPITFVTAPDPAEAARAAWPTAAAGALLAGLGAPIAWIALDAEWNAWGWTGALLTPSLLSQALPLALAVIAVPACLMGFYLMLMPRAAARRARDTVILVTDRRLVTLSVSGGTAATLPAHAILGVERTKVERGYGTLEVRHEPLGGSGPGASQAGQPAETVLSGIDDVLEAESAIRRLTAERASHPSEAMA